MHFARTAALTGMAAVAVHAQDYDNEDPSPTTYSSAAPMYTANSSMASGQCSNGYVCNNNMIQPTSADAQTLTYAYAIQNLLVKWYNSYDFTADAFSSLPNAQQEGMNGDTMAANAAANFAGLKQQAQLGLEAIQQLGEVVGASMPSCEYNLPPGLPNVTAAIMSATQVEATLCGAFIGGADYVYHPAVANLMARMSAEHGIHGSFLHTYTQAVPFSADSESLTPAFTPDQILSSGMGVGYLGNYIPEGCVSAPAPPCGASISFGPLLPATSGAGSMMSMTAQATATAGGAGGAGAMTTGGMGGAPYGATTPGMGAAQPTGSMMGGGAAAGGNGTAGAAGGTGVAAGTSSASTAIYTGAAAPQAIGGFASGLLGVFSFLGML
ncbi:hypothetical protein KC343_g349 [Hortaea werneckii]|nr:hypothetical protein KC352_g9440 [Hortaea werneckii]KAI7572835.1 hypothetical protein KC317_g405 [Hortaea werneckii]KAI7628161.1 hypothetical protein KC346_g353 [Hortaea werneckii]KAI7638034.1 hypothetical protein KC343_g349 [Hortaea werneckii]KAI7683697.1 hypothetical protein KC319_g337 [Hortaea werneckii]